MDIELGTLDVSGSGLQHRGGGVMLSFLDETELWVERRREAGNVGVSIEFRRWRDDLPKQSDGAVIRRPVLVRHGRAHTDPEGDHPVTDVDVDALLREFAEGGATWDSLVGSDAKQANHVFDRLHTLAKGLRQGPAGRAGLLALTSHEIQGVRLLAATECLAWSPEVAVPTLEAIEGSVGLHAVSAKYTLKSYRAGTLDLDW